MNLENLELSVDKIKLIDSYTLKNIVNEEDAVTVNNEVVDINLLVFDLLDNRIYHKKEPSLRKIIYGFSYKTNSDYFIEKKFKSISTGKTIVAKIPAILREKNLHREIKLYIDIITTKTFFYAEDIFFIKGDKNINNFVKIPTVQVYPYNLTNFNCVNSEEELKQNNYEFGEISGVWYLSNHIKKHDVPLEFKTATGLREFNWYKRLLTKQDKIKYGKDSLTYLITNNMQYTFGVELECATGALPKHLESKYSIMCEKDGSVFSDSNNKTSDTKYGPEYITDVLKGDSGMYMLKELMIDLQKRCTINNTAGVHVHIGNMSINKYFTVALYIICYKIQNEIFNMLPISRRNNEYCRLLPNLNFNLNNIEDELDFDIRISNYYQALFHKIGGTFPCKGLNSRHQHPRGSKAGYDHKHLRYCWANFLPLIFNTRNNINAKTIEFRPHSASLNYEKIKNWVLICMSIIKYAEDNSHNYEVLNNPISLNDVIFNAFKKDQYERLMLYIDKRKDKFNVLKEDESTEYIVQVEKSCSKKELINN